MFVLTPLVVAASHAKFWIPARYEELERIERGILKKNVKVPFEMLKVAGLGTVYVPCTSPVTKEPEEKKTLVLVHGFAAGNALWACVSGALGLIILHCTGLVYGKLTGVVSFWYSFRTWNTWQNRSTWCVPIAITIYCSGDSVVMVGGLILIM